MTPPDMHRQDYSQYVGAVHFDEPEMVATPMPAAPVAAVSTLRQKVRQTEAGLFEILLTGLLLFVSFYALTNAQSIATIMQNAFAQSSYPELLAARKDALAGLQSSTPIRGDLPPTLPVAGVMYQQRIQTPTEFTVLPPDNRIVIPAINKNIPLVNVSSDSLVNEDWKKLEDDIQEGLREGVVRYPGTADPGEFGNVFVTGHSSYYLWDPGEFKDVFALLHDLRVGDNFTIYWEGRRYDYTIYEREIVPPTQTDVLSQPTTKKIATLMTCTPVGTAKDRLILVAEQTN